MTQLRTSKVPALLAVLLVQLGLGERVVCLAPGLHPPSTGVQHASCHQTPRAATGHCDAERGCGADFADHHHHEDCVDVSLVFDSAPLRVSIPLSRALVPVAPFMKVPPLSISRPGLALDLAPEPPRGIRDLSSVVLTI
jgi:hypothetical protein